ncbi:hypothetical protein [Candidatus Ichthyocystis hellenicum]|uniref:hypothetical protein n=1 Tax=Candidatus Ichthyocystis hellenicum TaxID=1561003 RepID=UPI000B84AC68|nr:hypothetical protein [Candidatus Ichthyocystis hellenicum]
MSVSSANSTISHDYSTLDSSDQKESILNKEEPHVLSCLDTLSSNSNSSEEQELAGIMRKIDENYKEVKILSHIYSQSETSIENDYQVSFENALRELYNHLFVRDVYSDSFAKLWFDGKFTNASNIQKKEFINDFCSLIKAAKNLCKEKSYDESTCPIIVSEEEFRKLYLILVESLDLYQNTSISISTEKEQEIKDNLKNLYFLFFPNANEIHYESWINEEFIGSSEEKMNFAIEVIQMCKKARSGTIEKLNADTKKFSAGKLLKLISFLCEELGNINHNGTSIGISEYILKSMVRNEIHKLDLFNCEGSSSVVTPKYLQHLLCLHIEYVYRNYYNSIGKNEVAALVSTLAKSTGEIHRSNDTKGFISSISSSFNIESKILDSISGRKFTKEYTLVLYSQVPRSIRKEILNVLSSQSQDTTMFTELETDLDSAMNGKDELSDIIRCNVDSSDKNAAVLELLLCKDIILSLKQKNTIGEYKGSVTVTRSTLDKLETLSRFIENNGELKLENSIFKYSKELIDQITFDFSSASPTVAHKVSDILNKFGHPQALDAMSIATISAIEFVEKISYIALTSIREKLLSAKTNEEKFQHWSSVARDIEIEMLHLPEKENSLEELLAFMTKDLSSQEFDEVKKILSDISTSEKALEYIGNHCRSSIIKELRVSLNLWKKSFSVSINAVSKLLKSSGKHQSEWKKIICKVLNLYHHSKHNYFYQTDGTLPLKILRIAKNKCLPNVSNGGQHSVEVDGKEYKIPEAVLLDINRSTFVVQGKIITITDDVESNTKLAHNLTKIMMKEFYKLNLTSEALESTLALMNQNSAAQLVFAAEETSAFMFPEKIRLSSLPYMSDKTTYSVEKTTEGGLIFTCNILGCVGMLQEFPEGNCREISSDLDTSECANIIPLKDTSRFDDNKLPEQSAYMKVRINDDGTAHILDLRHVLNDITPDVVDNLISISNEYCSDWSN